MNTKDCKHIFGFLNEGENRTHFIDSHLTQVNGYTNIQWFKYCPKCGKKIGCAGILMTNDKFHNVLWKNRPNKGEK